MSIHAWRKRLALTSTLAVLTTLLGLMVGTSPAQAATNISLAGSVTCANGRAVTGVWVASTSGGAGFASWFAFPGRRDAAYYTRTLTFAAATSVVSLTVGCDGTPAKWWSSNQSPKVTVAGTSFTINVECTPARAGGQPSCTFPPKGLVTNFNQGDAGYCTAGAYGMWLQATGYYPDISGHAIDMDDHANAKGWRVTDTPARRAMIVFNRNKYGHVGWVTNIRNVGGVVNIDYIDMNGGALIDVKNAITTDFNRYVNRTTTWAPTDNVRFIQTWR